MSNAPTPILGLTVPTNGKVALIRMGDKFGRWTVIRSAKYLKPKKAYCLCECGCGEIKEVRHEGLLNGRSKSCGCLMREQQSARLFKHGFCDWRHGKIRPEWRAWKDMIQRCHNPNKANYPDYGGRGILVCARWRKSFVNFLDDIGERPSGMAGLRSLYSIERRDNNGNYEPKNCYWATRSEQRRNQRTSEEVRICRALQHRS
jgi:hypothetical protein